MRPRGNYSRSRASPAHCAPPPSRLRPTPPQARAGSQPRATTSDLISYLTSTSTLALAPRPGPSPVTLALASCAFVVSIGVSNVLSAFIEDTLLGVGITGQQTIDFAGAGFQAATVPG